MRACTNRCAVLLPSLDMTRNLPVLASTVKSEVVRQFSPLREVSLWPILPAVDTVPDVPLDPEEVEFRVRIGALISRVRLENDVSQEELAESVGVSVSTLGRWERGVNGPKSYQLAKLWRAFADDRMPHKVPADWWFTLPSATSDLDRAIAARVEAGRLAAYRPRRRATKRDAAAPSSPPAQSRARGRKGSTPH